MEGLFKALGFGSSKPEYAEKIPEDLLAEDFSLHETFHHGFPSQPTCMEYDPLQQILAIGTESGAVLLLGKPGLERYIRHPARVAVVKMQFIINKGLLVTCCSNDTLYLWSLKSQEPKVLHTLEFIREKEKPTCLSFSYKSDWLYVGSEGGNVFVVQIPTLVISGFIVYWNQALGPLARTRPGYVLSVLEHPMDQGKILIAYNGGHCVLYNMKHHQERSTSDFKQLPDHKQFTFNPGDNHIITSVCWVNCGRHFACSYSNGSIVLWSTKYETKPEKIFFLHESDPSQFRPIYKMQVMHTESDPLYVCSGGFPENSDEAPRTLTIIHGKSSSMLTASSTINDFLCLPSSPHACDCQKAFALVIMTKNEIIFHDLSTPGYPKFPSYSLPYALDIHLPAVSYVYYSSVCPEEFIAQLHSVKSKMMATSTKAWPLNGGRWGEEVPHSSTDIIITGHVDGSVRLWHCNSVVFQPFFTVDTSRYFKMCYNESPTSKSPTTPTSGPSPVKTPSPTTTATKPKSTPPSRPPPPLQAPPQSRIASEKNLQRAMSSSSSTSDVDQKSVASTEHEEGEGAGVTPSPATGQVHPVDQLQPAGQEQTDEGVIERISLSYKDKFKKSKRKSKGSMELRTKEDQSSSPSSPQPSTPSNDKKRSTMLSKKSFHKMSKMVKMRSSTDKGKQEQVDGEDTIPEEEGGEGEEGEGQGGSPSKVSPSSHPMIELEKPRKKRPPPRPSAIVLRKDSHLALETSNPKVTFTPSVGTSDEEGKRRLGSHSIDEDVPGHYKSLGSPHRLANRSRFSKLHAQADDDFFVISYLDMSVCGMWLSMANNGGNVMVFDFDLTPSKNPTPAGCLDINFDYDSIKKQYSPSTTPQVDRSKNLKPNTPGPTMPPSQWTYNNSISDSSSGYQLTQLCYCFYTSVAPQRDVDSSPSTPTTLSPKERTGKDTELTGRKLPVAINQIKYSVDIGLLVMATRRGFALVDTHNNTCVYTLSSSTSILYLADPSKFTSQIKRESKMNIVAHPSVKRHATSIRFNHDSRPRKRIRSAMDGPSTSSHHTNFGDEFGCVGGDTFGVSVELESCVSTLELVQLQMDKLAPPMLTMWVGLANGYVAAYAVNLVKNPSKNPSSGKRIELVPTRLIIESKSPIVNMFFLNEWGDRQVVPYKPNQSVSGVAERTHQPIQRRPSQSPLTCPSTHHYAIFVDETKIRSVSFPGLNKINVVTLPLPAGNVILRNEYVICSELPCLVTITSCPKIFIHSLPGINLLTTFPFPSLRDPQAMSTFRVSGNGQGLYMSSASEIQRISIVKENMLNFPDCLPYVYTKREDVGPSSYGKGLFGALFSGGPTTVNRNEMFGDEGSLHPIGNIAKVDGKVGRSPRGSRKGKEQESKSRSLPRERTSPEKDRAAGERSVYRKGNRSTVRQGSGLSGRMNKNLVALDERKEKLHQTELKTEEMADAAQAYLDSATQLAKKFAK